MQGIIKHLRKVLTRHPPPAPTEAAIRLVEAVGKLQNFVHRHRYAEANSRLNNRDIFGRFVLEWISSSAAQLSLRCRRLEQGAAGQHGWQEFASDGGCPASEQGRGRREEALGCAAPWRLPLPQELAGRQCHHHHASPAPRTHPYTHPPTYFTPCLPAGKNKVAHLVEDMLNAVQSEMSRYQRIITYWPMYGPDLERAVTGALREATMGVSRQCGLVQIKVCG